MGQRKQTGSGKKLTKAKIVEGISREVEEISRGSSLQLQTRLRACDVNAMVGLFFKQIKDALADDGVVELRGFGTFEIRSRKGRARARNPRTGKIASVSDHGVVAFRPGKELRQLAWPLRK